MAARLIDAHGESVTRVEVQVRLQKVGAEILGVVGTKESGEPILAAIDYREPTEFTRERVTELMAAAVAKGFCVEAILSDGRKVLIIDAPGSQPGVTPPISPAGDGDPSGDREPRNPIPPTLAPSMELELVD